MTDKPNRDAVLEALARKWRKEAEEFGKIYKETGRDMAFRINAIRNACADELEAALQSLPEPVLVRDKWDLERAAPPPVPVERNNG